MIACGVFPHPFPPAAIHRVSFVWVTHLNDVALFECVPRHHAGTALLQDVLNVMVAKVNLVTALAVRPDDKRGSDQTRRMTRC